MVSEVKSFFRHCPACGRRFEVRLVKKEQKGEDSGGLKDFRRVDPSGGSVPVPVNPVILEENVTALVDKEEFDYTYRCKHCGHQWTEAHDKEEVLKAPSDYSGD